MDYLPDDDNYRGGFRAHDTGKQCPGESGTWLKCCCRPTRDQHLPEPERIVSAIIFNTIVPARRSYVVPCFTSISPTCDLHLLESVAADYIRDYF
jgi:hypothetical protein